jgi:hypothetical protein
MSFKLILALSTFGLFMAFATVFFIPSRIEPLCWLAIFVVCAVIIARSLVPRPFLHGLGVSIVNSVWITSAHIVFFDTYVAGHAQEAQMMVTDSPIPGRVMMLIIGPIVGLISGCVLGLFALIASKLIRPKPAPAP